MPVAKPTSRCPDEAVLCGRRESEKIQSWHWWGKSKDAKDGFDVGDPGDSLEITIQNSPPTAVHLSISPNPPLGDHNLVATFSYMDEDDDTQQLYEIKWYQGVFLQDIDGLVVESAATGKDELWYYVLRVYDGEVWSENLSSHFVVIHNSMPNVTSVTPSTGQLTINETESLDFSVTIIICS